MKKKQAAPLFNTVVIVGVGLLGSSIGMNLIRKKIAKHVVGVGRDTANLKIAIKRKSIHEFVLPHEAPMVWNGLSSKDLIIFSGPVTSIREYLQDFSHHSGKKKNDGPLLIDVGSTKKSIIQTAQQRGLRFIGTHPLAGTENSGAVAGMMDLYEGRTCLLTPLPKTSGADLKKVKALWHYLGATAVILKSQDHDKTLAVTSHLPHVAAYALAKTVGESLPLAKLRSFSFSSLRDTTRISKSPVPMWRDIFLENKDEVIPLAKKLLKNISQLIQLLENRDDKALSSYLEKGQQLRTHLD